MAIPLRKETPLPSRDCRAALAMTDRVKLDTLEQMPFSTDGIPVPGDAPFAKINSEPGADSTGARSDEPEQLAARTS